MDNALDIAPGYVFDKQGGFATDKSSGQEYCPELVGVLGFAAWTTRS